MWKSNVDSFIGPSTWNPEAVLPVLEDRQERNIKAHRSLLERSPESGITTRDDRLALHSAIIKDNALISTIAFFEEFDRIGTDPEVRSRLQTLKASAEARVAKLLEVADPLDRALAL